ncbi:MAG: MBL fold metallo-hydrolase, partial [Gemmatimonadetes bacterium]|nr:MBL fold metallo-hydrolase [Gemmatimonadota bacterium]
MRAVVASRRHHPAPLAWAAPWGVSAWTLARATVCVVAAVAIAACGRDDARRAGTPAASEGGATPATIAANAKVARELALSDTLDQVDARRGLVARPTGTITDSTGAVLVNFDALAFLEGNAPPTVNPSLWRHAKLDAQVGLYQVTDGVWQLRGFDLANMTLIAGKTGWIVVDPLTVRETAAAALALARSKLGAHAVSALVFTHSHIDHFGGALGALAEADAKARTVPIVAPAGFMDEATSENVLAGTAMGR